MKPAFGPNTSINLMQKYCSLIFRCNSTSTTDAPTPRTFSGIQPTGTIHLGNYLGAVKSWVDGVAKSSTDLRDQNLFSVVNLHAITLPQDPTVLKENTYAMAASLIACGLQPDKVCLKDYKV